RLEAPERLQVERVVEDDGAVRLLALDRTRGDELGAEPGEALDVVELDRRVARGALGDAGADEVHELARDRRLGEPVERLADEQLVDLVRPFREDDLEQHEHQARQLDVVDDARPSDLAALRAVPALRRHVVDELPLVERAEPCHAESFLSWNQNHPRGASVSRYGSFPIRGNPERPSISSGTYSSNSERSSSTACAERARL